MRLRSLRNCNKIGCAELTRDTYCEQHKQEPHRYYDQYVRDPQYDRFYKSAQWKKKREQVLRRDGYLCQQCLNQERYQQADMVHHIVEVKDNWSKRLELSNLVSLCHSCHNKIHK